ncbi:hypothetical protein VTO42DRAFT_5954 [Malbranchea cinnamomea]
MTRDNSRLSGDRELPEQQPTQQFNLALSMRPSHEDVDIAQPESVLQIPTPDASCQSAFSAGHTQSLDILDFLPSIWGSTSRPASGEYGSGAWTPRSVMDFGLETNLELNDIDLSFLDTYNVHVPFDNQTPSEHHTSSSSVVGIGAEAFRKSVWRYNPRPLQSGAQERENLPVPIGNHEGAAVGVKISRRHTSESLPQTARDRLLAMFLSTCKPTKMTRLALSFPSVELLDNLLQYFLTSPFSSALSWLHFPTLSPAKIKSPELLAGMIAAGAVLTPDATLIKLGYAFQEAVRSYLPLVFEEDNSKIRELHVLQAFMLEIEIGLWSGVSRKIEISESFQQPLLTMVRRAGKFRRSSYEAIVPQPEDEGTSLEEKWVAWVEQESYKRLVFHLFQHDAQVSMALSNNPLISYAEMHLPLPAPRELWLADTAARWKEVFLSKMRVNPTTDRRFGLVDCVKEVELLHRLSQVTDAAESNLAFLYGAWRMVWEFKQLSAVMKNSMYDGGLVMRSRYQDLISLLQSFRISSDESTATDAGRSTLVLELILMHLHVSLEDIQLFAGLEGQEDAVRVYPSLRDWVNTSSSRSAVWHAGQIIRVAKLMPPRLLRDFVAIAVYHASLTFWAYGVILNTPEGSSKAHRSEVGYAAQPVWLDGTETTDAQRFIALERGIPGIRGVDNSQSPAFLDNPSAVIDVVVGILKRNHEMSGEQQQQQHQSTKPPLVENLIQLMHGLRNAMKRANM